MTPITKARSQESASWRAGILEKRSVQPSLSTSDRSIGKHSTYAHSQAWRGPCGGI